MDLFDRQLPCNLEAERNVLGSMLIAPATIDDVATILRTGDFLDDAHNLLYHHLHAMHNDGNRIDMTLLVDRLKTADDFEKIGGAAFLAEVSQSVPTSANAVYYARIVAQKAVLRSCVTVGSDIARQAYDASDADSVLNQAEQSVFAIRDRRRQDDVSTIHDALLRAFERIDQRIETGGAGGLPTGLFDLDKKMGGLHAGELTIVAARPSMGKTALACNIAEHVAMRENRATLLCSLEMSEYEICQRMLCSLAKVPGEKLRSGFLSSTDHQKLIEASAKLSHSPLFIDDTPTRTASDIGSVARRIKRKEGDLGLVVVDYLQLLEPDAPADNRQEQVAKMARRLKAMARELDAPVICVAQLNRQAEQAKDNRPRLSHLRESGAIEQDADVVLLVHRDEYYLSPEEQEAMRSGANPNSKLGEADVIVAKQRNGPTGTIHLHWSQTFTRFDNLARQNQLEW